MYTVFVGSNLDELSEDEVKGQAVFVDDDSDEVTGFVTSVEKGVMTIVLFDQRSDLPEQVDVLRDKLTIDEVGSFFKEAIDANPDIQELWFTNDETPTTIH